MPKIHGTFVHICLFYFEWNYFFFRPSTCILEKLFQRQNSARITQTFLVQKSQHVCLTHSVFCRVSISHYLKKFDIRICLLHSVGFMNCLTLASSCLWWYMYALYKISAHDGLPSHPTRPISCNISTRLFGGPNITTLLTFFNIKSNAQNTRW